MSLETESTGDIIKACTCVYLHGTCLSQLARVPWRQFWHRSSNVGTGKEGLTYCPDLLICRCENKAKQLAQVLVVSSRASHNVTVLHRKRQTRKASASCLESAQGWRSGVHCWVCCLWDFPTRLLSRLLGLVGPFPFENITVSSKKCIGMKLFT